MNSETPHVFLRTLYVRKQGCLHPDASGPVDWRRIIDLQVRQFKRYVLGKQEMYIPLEIR